MNTQVRVVSVAGVVLVNDILAVQPEPGGNASINNPSDVFDLAAAV